MTNAGEFYRAYMAYVDQQDKAVIALTLITLALLTTWLLSGSWWRKETGITQALLKALYFGVPVISLAIYTVLCVFLWGNL